jgi:hypothetical protein
MSKRDPAVDAYVRKAPAFAQPIIEHLREVVHAACPEVEECIKWSVPFFVYVGGDSMKGSVQKGRERRASSKRSERDGRAKGTKASRLIDRRIEELGGWRAGVLARVRALIQEADPEIVEEWKWMGTPVWSHHGIVCTGEAYTKVVKLTFARGAALQDPDRLFNSSLGGNARRAIDIHEGEKFPEVRSDSS